MNAAGSARAAPTPRQTILDAAHVALLERHGIPLELAAAAGLFSATDAEVRELLGVHGRLGENLVGLVFPYRHPRTGQVLGHRVRLDRPPTCGPKYLMEAGCRFLFLPPVDPAWLDDPSVPAVMVEAEKSALALIALAHRGGRKLLPIATGGCWGWRRKVGSELQPDGIRRPVTGPSPSLGWVAWKGREAITCLDADSGWNPEVAHARRELAAELAGHGASVRVARIPPDAGEKAGPDDLLATAGDEAMLAVLTAARPWVECRLAEAEQAVRALEELDPAARKRVAVAQVTEVLAAVAAVEDALASAALAARLASSRLPGFTKGVIDRAVQEHRVQANALRQAAAEAARRGRLLGMRVDLAALLDTLARWVRLFVVMLGAGADVVALWIVHTHALDAADFTPYLRIKSPEKRCGKTLLEELLELVVARPWRCDRTTPAALLRRVERDRPTLLLDEVDAAMRSGEEYAEALRGLLDSGYRRGNTYTMCVPAPGNGWEVRDWPTWCPKAIAGIGELPGTVADRSIPILLRRKSRHERVQRFRRRKVEPEAAALREQCEAWALQAVERVREAEPHLPEALNDRQQDVCEPLLAIADLAGGEWPERARRALVELCTGAAAADDSFGVRLLGDIRAVFAERQADRREGDRIASRDLAGALGQMEDRPWPEWRAGKPITAPQVARLLGRFGIVPRTIRLADGTTPKGYLASDFEDAWERYLPPEGGAEETTPPSPSDSNRHNATTRINTAENANFQTATGPPCGGSKSATFTTKNAACGGVAFTKREYRQGAYQQSLFEDDRDPSRATPHLPRRQGIGPAQELEHFDL